MKILYIASEPTLAMNINAIAYGTQSVFPAVVNILVDPREYLWPSCSTPLIAERIDHSLVRLEQLERQEYEDIFSYRFPDRSYLFYLRLFERTRPSVIVVMHEYGYSFYAVQAAKIAGIPSYHVQHGIFEPEHFELNAKLKITTQTVPRRVYMQLSRFGCAFVTQLGKLVKKQLPKTRIPHGIRLINEPNERYPLYADKFAAWSQYYKLNLMEHRPAFSDECIDVIGFPHLDSRLRNGVMTRKELYDIYGFAHENRIAIYIYCPFHEFKEQFEIKIHPDEALLDALTVLRKIDPGINVLVLTHPNYSQSATINRLKQLLNCFNDVKIGDNSRYFIDLCCYSHIVLGVMSSLFYIAMHATIPVVIQAYVVSDLIDYMAIEGLAAMPVFYKITLFDQINTALNDKACGERLRYNQKKLADKLLGYCDSRSGVRAAEGIQALLHRNNDGA